MCTKVHTSAHRLNTARCTFNSIICDCCLTLGTERHEYDSAGQLCGNCLVSQSKLSTSSTPPTSGGQDGQEGNIDDDNDGGCL